MKTQQIDFEVFIIQATKGIDPCQHSALGKLNPDSECKKITTKAVFHIMSKD